MGEALERKPSPVAVVFARGPPFQPEARVVLGGRSRLSVVSYATAGQEFAKGTVSPLAKGRSMLEEMIRGNRWPVERSFVVWRRRLGWASSRTTCRPGKDGLRITLHRFDLGPS